MKRSTKLNLVISALLLASALSLVLCLIFVPNARPFIRRSLGLTVDDPPTAAPTVPLISPKPSPPAEGDALQVYFLNVEQGDCAFLRSPSGKTLLLDAGEAETASTVLAFLTEQKIDTLDLLIASHMHSDHVGAMPAVIYAHRPDAFVMPQGGKEDAALLNALTRKDVPVIHANAATHLAWDVDVKLTLLSPLPNTTYSDENQGSLMLHIQYGASSVLFTGDAGYEAEDLALRAQNAALFRADILKLGHHGSSSATTPRFLYAVQPKYAVISCGLDNRYGHPHQSVLNQLAQQSVRVFRTDQDGTIHALLYKNEVQIESER